MQIVKFSKENFSYVLLPGSFPRNCSFELLRVACVERLNSKDQQFLCKIAAQEKIRNTLALILTLWLYQNRTIPWISSKEYSNCFGSQLFNETTLHVAMSLYMLSKPHNRLLGFHKVKSPTDLK